MTLTQVPRTMITGLTKSDVGLSNVDNTADSAKPVSTAIQTALDLKAPIASPTFTGTVGGVTKAMVGLGSVDNTSDAAKPISTATQTALDLKAPLASPTFTGTVSGVTKSMVGLGNVDNTSDANKPVSTAGQAALDLKQGLNSSLTALATPGSIGTIATRTTRLNLGTNGLGAVYAFGRNSHNAGGEYSGLQIGGGYAADGTDGVTIGPDGHASWPRIQPSKDLSPVELAIYSTMKQGFGSVVAAGNQITYVSGSSFGGMAVGKKIYIDETAYLISANTGTVITVTTLGGGAVSFASSTTVVFHYGYISGSGLCSISGSTVTRISGDPFLPFYSLSSFVFKTGGTARTVTSFTDTETYGLSTGPGDTGSTSYSFEVDINDQISTFRIAKMIGADEENLSLYSRYDGYWIHALKAGSGEYRKIVLGSGEAGGNLNKQIVIQKNGDLSLGGDASAEALKVLAPSGTPVNRFEVQAGVTGSPMKLRAKGSDTNVGVNVDVKGSQDFKVMADDTRTLLHVVGGASVVNYMKLFSAATGFGAVIQTLGSDSSVPLTFDVKGTTSNVTFTQGGFARVMAIISSASAAVNYPELSATNTGVAVVVAAKGETNVGIKVKARGSGNSALTDSGDVDRVAVNTTGLGFHGTAPIAKPTLAADSTDLATVITLANDIKAKLVSYGLAA